MWAPVTFPSTARSFVASFLLVLGSGLACGVPEGFLQREGAGSNKALPRPQRTYLLKDPYKEIMIRNPGKVGSVGLR